MLSALNRSQRAAVEHLDSPCLILAGAGSGKTRVITQKICLLIKKHGFDPKHIAALTFTNKAAKEMYERVSKAISNEEWKNTTKETGKRLKNQVRICTFHSLGMEILRIEAKHLGLKQQFSILDNSDSVTLLHQHAPGSNQKEIYSIKQQISLWKNNGVNPEEALCQADTEALEKTAIAYGRYASTLCAYQAVDFDDLILLPTSLFKKNQEIREKWSNKLRYILVDEYQDTNFCQYELLKFLTSERKLFTAVGDDDQAIYGWRGASADNISKLMQDFPNCHVIKLEQNYRSSQSILEAANRVISHNPKLYQKQLWCKHGPGDAVTVTEMITEEQEAESTVFKLSGHRIEKQAQWQDYAILYRSNFQARTIEKILRRENIPYTISGGQSFFDKTEIKDVYAYLRLITNQDDNSAFIRAVTTPRRGIGNQTLEDLGTLAGRAKVSLFQAAQLGAAQITISTKQRMLLNHFCDFINEITKMVDTTNFNNLLDLLLTEIDYKNYLYDMFDSRAAQSKWQNIIEFIEWLKKKESQPTHRGPSILEGKNNLLGDHLTSEEKKTKNLFEIVQNIALMSILDNNQKNANAINLSTIHAAKGLEYPHVFLIGCEEDLLPHRSIDDSLQHIEEERRLMYVAITRSQRSLHISWCKKRRRGGETVICKRSRFIDEMGIKLATKSPPSSPEKYLAAIRTILKT